MRNFKSVAFIVSTAALLAACSSPTKLNETPVVEKSPTPAAPAADPRDINPVQTGSVDPLNDPQGVLAKRSIYFDYDSFVVKPEYQGLVDQHARFLQANKGRSISLEGNTDERGSREYNLALGQKRADAVKKQLVLLGAREDQVESVSLGEEKPKNTAQNEAAWAENRRGDMLYSGEF